MGQREDGHVLVLTLNVLLPAILTHAPIPVPLSIIGQLLQASGAELACI